jgi:hypothetical protein
MSADGGWRTDRPTTAIYALIVMKRPIPGLCTLPKIARYIPREDVWEPAASIFADDIPHDLVYWHPLPPPREAANEC